MPRPDKVAAVTDVRERLEGANAAVLTEYRGLTVTELAQLRAKLRETDAEYKVVKNTLTRLAALEAGFEVPDQLLTGPTAITFCAGDPVAVAKVLRAFSKDHPALVVKGGIMDGALLDAAETLRLADLASREELLAQLAGLMEAVLAQPARLAQASLTKMARLFAALQERKPADPAPSAAEAPAERAPEPASDEADAPAVEGKAAEEAAEPASDEADAPAAEAPAEEAAEPASDEADAPAESTPEASTPADTTEPAPATEATAEEPAKDE